MHRYKMHRYKTYIYIYNIYIYQNRYNIKLHSTSKCKYYSTLKSSKVGFK